MLRNIFECACAHTTRQFSQLVFGLALAAAVAVSSTASAGLVFNSVRFDGHVRSGNGSGGTLGVEQHFMNDDFPEPTDLIPLPATNAALPAPLDPSNNLRMRLDFSANAPLNGDNFPLSTLWITSPTTGEVFANELDDFLTTPVEFETFLYLEELAPGQKLIFEAIQVESGVIFPAAETTVISPNRGSEDDPIRIQLGLTQEQVSFGLLKVRLFYSTGPVPEPATLTLFGLGLVGFAGLGRHRRS